jgi:hypothetical protein
MAVGSFALRSHSRAVLSELPVTSQWTAEDGHFVIFEQARRHCGASRWFLGSRYCHRARKAVMPPIDQASNRKAETSETRKAKIKEVILLHRGKWGIIADFLLEEKEFIGKEVLVGYDEIDDIREARDGCLMIETLAVPVVRPGDTIEITIRDRSRKKRKDAIRGKPDP